MQFLCSFRTFHILQHIGTRQKVKQQCFASWVVFQFLAHGLVFFATLFHQCDGIKIIDLGNDSPGPNCEPNPVRKSIINNLNLCFLFAKTGWGCTDSADAGPLAPATFSPHYRTVYDGLFDCALARNCNNLQQPVLPSLDVAQKKKRIRNEMNNSF